MQEVSERKQASRRSRLALYDDNCAVQESAADVAVVARSFRRTAEILGVLFRPQIRRDYPLNLSILLGGGKETNKDSLSSGERTGRSPARNPAR